MSRTIVGIAGLGVIGKALHRWFVENTEHRILVSDPKQKRFDDLKGAEAVFVSVPADTSYDGPQDLSNIAQVCESLQATEAPVFIRSTVLPGTCDILAKRWGLSVLSMPEFLTARVAVEDFRKHPVLIGGDARQWKALVTKVLPGKEQVWVKTWEAEMAKYTSNVFGAIKVTYFNWVFSACEELGLDYTQVLRAAQIPGFIESTHTLVPGPDGQKGFGGHCLPKDLKAFTHYLHHQLGLEPNLFRACAGDNESLRLGTEERKPCQLKARSYRKRCGPT